MSDDNTRQEDGIILPAGAAVGGFYAGSLLASHASGKNLHKKIVALEAAKDKAHENYKEAYKEVTKRGGELREPARALEQAATALAGAEKKHFSELADEWVSKFGKLTEPAKIGQYHIAHLEGTLKHLESISSFKGIDIEDISDVLKAEIKASKEAIADSAFSTLSPVDAWQKFRDASHATVGVAEPKVRGALNELKEHNNSVILSEFSKVDSAITKTVADATNGTQTALDLALKKLERKQSAFEEVEGKLLGKELAQMEKVGIKAKIIGNMQKLNSEEGFLAAIKRPWDIIRQGSSRAKVFTAVSGIALGALAYSSLQSTRTKPSDSYSSRVEDGRSQNGGPRLA